MNDKRELQDATDLIIEARAVVAHFKHIEQHGFAQPFTEEDARWIMRYDRVRDLLEQARA